MTAEPAPALLVTRVASAVVLVPVALGAVYGGGPWLQLLVCAIALVLVWEWAGLCLAHADAARLWWPRPPLAALALLGVIAVVMGAALMRQFAAAIAFAAAAGVVAVAAGHGAKARLLGAGAAYIGVPLAAMLWLAEDPAFGRISLFWLLGVVWATDSGAYLAGRMIGGPRLAPAISPRKTWAGAAGGLVFAAAVGAGAAVWAKVAEPAGLIAASVVLSLAAQGGDLLESAVKRHFEVKDSGAIIPGHGGLFDRLDGLMVAAPVLAAAYLLAGGGDFLWR